MTTWASGDTITSAWLNTVEPVLAYGTWGTNRLTISPNSTFDIASNLVANNFRVNGSVTVPANKYYQAIDFRSLTSTQSAGTGWASCITYDHQANTAAGTGSYFCIGSVTGLSGSGKINPAYFRVVGTSSFTGIGECIQAYATSVAGLTWNGYSALIGMGHDTTDTSVSFPIGILVNTNTAGAKMANIMVVLDSIEVTGSYLQWNVRAGTGATVDFLKIFNSSNEAIFEVQNGGNLYTVGQVASFYSATNDINNASYTALQTLNGASVLNSSKNGTGALQALALQMNSNSILYIDTSGGMLLGQAGATTADTTGHIYIQGVAGAPTGVPTVVAGYVPMRYDTTNDYLYVYNGGWKKSAVYS